jgi:hypothetical protein
MGRFAGTHDLDLAVVLFGVEFNEGMLLLPIIQISDFRYPIGTTIMIAMQVAQPSTPSMDGGEPDGG